MLTALLLSMTLAADVPAYIIDDILIETQEQRDLLTTAIKAHFGTEINLQASQRFYCSRMPQQDGAKLDTCTLVEAGAMTRREYADVKKARVNNIKVLKIDGDTVTYQKVWAKELVQGPEGPVAIPIVVTKGARRDALVAYLQALHPDVTLEFLLDVAVTRKLSAGGDTILSHAVYLSAIDDINTAQLELDGKLHQLAPEGT